MSVRFEHRNKNVHHVAWWRAKDHIIQPYTPLSLSFCNMNNQTIVRHWLNQGPTVGLHENSKSNMGLSLLQPGIQAIWSFWEDMNSVYEWLCGYTVTYCIFFAALLDSDIELNYKWCDLNFKILCLFFSDMIKSKSNKLHVLLSHTEYGNSIFEDKYSVFTWG